MGNKLEMKKLLVNKPWVILSAAISLDGKISTLYENSELSNLEDWSRVHKLRANSDAIMVGSGTIRTDNSKLTVKDELIGRKPKNHPIRIVVSSRGDLPFDARIFTNIPENPLTILATTKLCPTNVKKKFENLGVEVLICGDGPLTDLPLLLEKLYIDYNIRNLMVEGGSKLNGSLLEQKLIDEVQLAIAPVICGEGIPLFSLKQPIENFSESPTFSFQNLKSIGDMIWIRILIDYKKREV
ncbi:MAG: 5-amino-6-(5-phosphoribosylamino)uracil reductase [Candidatus Heimdallarchaeota archaeon]|nr:5-amino-6-(5-phosphoribosylamino)uracil reductase [Candidatus Heimdallarchaeota archaeon]